METKTSSRKLYEIKQLIRHNLSGDKLPIIDLIDVLEKELETNESKQKPAEWIICAANHYEDGIQRTFKPKNITTGFVICGRRHHNCISTFAQMVGFPYSPESQKLHNTEVQGFLTNTDRFVNRKEAYKIAFEADQICGPNKGYAENSIGLTSEDLY